MYYHNNAFVTFNDDNDVQFEFEVNQIADKNMHTFYLN